MDRVEKAFAFAADTSKQLITLATAILTFSIAFSEKMGVQARDASLGRWLLALAWIVYVASIIFGIWTQLGMTGELQPETMPNPPTDPSIRERVIKIPFRLQIIAFLGGTLLALAFGIWRIAEPEIESAQAEEAAVYRVEQWFVESATGEGGVIGQCRTTPRLQRTADAAR